MTTATVNTLPRRTLLGPLVRGATEFPLAVAAIPMAVIGAGNRLPAARGRRRVTRGRLVGRSLSVLIPSLVAFALTVLVLFLTYSGYLYFLRPTALPALDHPFTPDSAFDGAWGGPTLAGAWFTHSMVALGMQVLCFLGIRAMTGVSDQVTARWLGPRN